MDRPTSVTVISWILIVLGGFSLITTTTMINNPAVQDVMAQSPLPVPVQYAMSYVGLLIMVICGFCMLKGKNWARSLYVTWSVIGLVIGFATSPMKAAMIPGVVVFVIIAFFLFRPKANAFFATGEEAESEQGASQTADSSGPTD